MKETLLAIGYLVALFFIAGIFLFFRDRISDALWRRRNTPEKLDAERKVYQNRIRAPDWDFYERHLERKVPDAIRDLFSDAAIVQSDLAVSCGDQVISSFGAIDEANLVDSRGWIGTDIVAIAHNEFGDPIYLRPGRDETNAVYVTYHDGGDTEQIAADAAEFVDNIRPGRTGG